MTRDEAAALIAKRLGNRTDLSAMIVDEMQLVQEDLLEMGERLPWFLLTDVIAFVTVANTATVDLPADFLLECNECDLEIQDTSGSWRALTKKELFALQSKFRTETTATQPTHYALVNAQFVLFPTPDAAYNLRTRYYAKADVLATNITNAWLTYAKSWFIDTVTAVMAAKYLMNPQLAKTYEGAALVAATKIFKRDEARQQTNMMASMGDD
jgi:hypothetical protein